MYKNIKVAVVGQPNVGKSMLINSLTNASLHTGNFAGVSVDSKIVELVYGGYTISSAYGYITNPAKTLLDCHT